MWIFWAFQHQNYLLSINLNLILYTDLPKPEESRAKLGDLARPAKSCADLKETGIFKLIDYNFFNEYNLPYFVPGEDKIVKSSRNL